ncbi:MAG: aldehyde dehydrogenase EutE [Planctomycetota bacterium]|nr:MAG: aldehyde dehydrogenase EutE [Planctomycetota bacterium]REJ93809.1 MAG: aldehyde dehydrogenase EutE [Planctomycetota bacterium]REK21145.1 MAG: aldehyde dehydrogenase EutE [Planctomycetota bacterium]REK29553.1 MAG: aldehyde dehydrogenase EutE [Planctomycetota bacterium]
MPATEQTIRSVVEEVLAELGKRPGTGGGAPPARVNGNGSGIPVMSAGRPARVSAGAAASGGGDWGVFQSVDAAVAAAQEAFEQLQRKPIADRAKVVNIVKSLCEQNAEQWGREELEETKIGRLDHKIEKLQIIKLVPGTEWLKSDSFSGDHGLTVIEYAPFGVIGGITPVTHSLPTLAGNVINMVAAGNTVVFNPHPSGARIACAGVRAFNRAFAEAIGIENLVTIIEQPTIESADEIFQHRGIRMLCVTGGPGVASAALAARKKSVVAGPGNPPVVVDETADLDNAARSIVAGAAYDNNLLCIGEKQVFAVNSIFDDLLAAMGRSGGYKLSGPQIDALTRLAFSPPKEPGGHAVLNRDLVGKDAAVLAEQIGVRVPAGTQLLYGEADTSNPFVPEEQMMPFVPFVRARDAEQAIAMAHESEHGFGHTAVIHSRNVHNMTTMGKLMNTTLFIKNGPCMSGLGLGGEGYLSFSVATPTGEGVTNPLTFTRSRRCVMVDELRIV